MNKIFLSLILILVGVVQAQEQSVSNGGVVSLYRAGLMGTDTLPEDQRLAMAVYSLHRSEKFPEATAEMWEVTKQYLQKNASQPVNDRLQIVELFFSTLENTLANIETEAAFTNVWNVRKAVLEERNHLAELLHAEGKTLLETNENAIIEWVKTPVDSGKEQELEKPEFANLKTVFDTISVLDTLECAAPSAQAYQKQLDGLKVKIIAVFQEDVDKLFKEQDSQVTELKTAGKIETIIPAKKTPAEKEESGKTAKAGVATSPKAEEWAKGKATLLLEDVQDLTELVADSFIDEHFHISELKEFDTLCQRLAELNEKVRRLQILRYNAWATVKIQYAKTMMDMIHISSDYLHPVVSTIYGEKQAELISREEEAIERRRTFIMRQIYVDKVPLSAF